MRFRVEMKMGRATSGSFAPCRQDLPPETRAREESQPPVPPRSRPPPQRVAPSLSREARNLIVVAPMAPTPTPPAVCAGVWVGG